MLFQHHEKGRLVSVDLRENTHNYPIKKSIEKPLFLEDISCYEELYSQCCQIFSWGFGCPYLLPHILKHFRDITCYT